MKFSVNQYVLPKFCEYNKKYEERLIVFLDILGSSEKITKYTHPNALLHIYKQVYEAFSNHVNSLGFNYYHIERLFEKDMDPEITKSKKFEISYFSDSIIISIPLLTNKNKENEMIFYQFCNSIILTLTILFNQGILVRGGLVNGQVFHENQFCIGPGLIDAYNLDKHGGHPIITIKYSHIQDVPELSTYEKEEELLFLSPLTSIKKSVLFYDSLSSEKFNEYFNKSTLNQIENNLLSSLKHIIPLLYHKAESVRNKGIWLYEQHSEIEEKLFYIGEKNNISLTNYTRELLKIELNRN